MTRHEFEELNDESYEPIDLTECRECHTHVDPSDLKGGECSKCRCQVCGGQLIFIPEKKHDQTLKCAACLATHIYDPMLNRYFTQAIKEDE